MLSNAEKSVAYTEVKERFGLRAAMRDRLDVSPHYEAIMKAAHEGNWIVVEELLKKI